MTKEPKIDRQREHQANERTFLAWIRTSVSLIAFGFAIARFGIFLQQLHLTLTRQEAPSNPFLSSQTLGIILVIASVVVTVIAALRYNQVFWQIERGDYRPNRLVIWLMTAIVIILGLLSLPLLLWRTRSSKNSAVTPNYANLHLPLDHARKIEHFLSVIKNSRT
jgi:putative membrane protein